MLFYKYADSIDSNFLSAEWDFKRLVVFIAFIVSMTYYMLCYSVLSQFEWGNSFYAFLGFPALTVLMVQIFICQMSIRDVALAYCTVLSSTKRCGNVMLKFNNFSTSVKENIQTFGRIVKVSWCKEKNFHDLLCFEPGHNCYLLERYI